MKNTLPKATSHKKIKSPLTDKQMLKLIEEYCCEVGDDNKELTTVYTWVHAHKGTCIPHENWRKYLKKSYDYYFPKKGK